MVECLLLFYFSHDKIVKISQKQSIDATVDWLTVSSVTRKRVPPKGIQDVKKKCVRGF